MNKIQFETDGMTIAITPRRGDAMYHDDWWEIDTEDRLELTREHPQYPTATRVYVGKYEVDLPKPADSVRGENADLDRAWDDYNAAEVEAQRAKVVRAVTALAEHGIAIDPARLVHTRMAGCAICPCSPGMLTDAPIAAADGTTVDDIYIDY